MLIFDDLIVVLAAGRPAHTDDEGAISSATSLLSTWSSLLSFFPKATKPQTMAMASAATTKIPIISPSVEAAAVSSMVAAHSVSGPEASSPPASLVVPGAQVSQALEETYSS